MSCKQVTGPAWPLRVATGAESPVFHKRTVESQAALATRVGEMSSSEETMSVWPVNVRLSLPLLACHMRMLLSLEALSSQSLVNARNEVTMLE